MGLISGHKVSQAVGREPRPSKLEYRQFNEWTLVTIKPRSFDGPGPAGIKSVIVQDPTSRRRVRIIAT